MSPVFFLALLLAVSVASIRLRPQFRNEVRFVEPSAGPRASQLPVRTDYNPDDVERVAIRKRQYQATIASLATQMARDIQLFSPAPKNNFVIEQHPSIYNQKDVPLFQKSQVTSSPVFANSRNYLKTRPPVVYQQPSVAQIHNRYNGEEYRQNTGQPNQKQEELVILPNGFLADTEEVRAAKEAHFAAVAKAQAVAARAEAREAKEKYEAGYSTQNRPQGYAPRDENQYYTGPRRNTQYIN